MADRGTRAQVGPAAEPTADQDEPLSLPTLLRDAMEDIVQGAADVQRKVSAAVSAALTARRHFEGWLVRTDQEITEISHEEAVKLLREIRALMAADVHTSFNRLAEFGAASQLADGEDLIDLGATKGLDA